MKAQMKTQLKTKQVLKAGLIAFCSFSMMTSCARVLQKQDFENGDKFYHTASELTESVIKEKRSIQKVALIGFADIASGWGNFAGGNKEILAAALPYTDKILQDLGYTVTPVQEVINNPFYKTLGHDESPISLLGVGWQFAQGLRIQPGHVIGMFGGNAGFANLSDEDASKLIDALNVDGLISVTTHFDGRTAVGGDNGTYMALHVKDSQHPEKAKFIWIGKLKPHQYDGQLTGAEQFRGAFQLLAARMKLDLKD